MQMSDINTRLLQIYFSLIECVCLFWGIGEFTANEQLCFLSTFQWANPVSQ